MYILSFLWHKILVLIFNMYVYLKHLTHFKFGLFIVVYRYVFQLLYNMHIIMTSRLLRRREWLVFVCLMVLNATFNNISVISWRSVLLVEETGGPGKNHWPVVNHWQTLSHIFVHLALSRIQAHNISDDRHWLHR